LWESLENNKAKAQTTYEGNMYKVTVRVQNIETNFFEYKEQYNGHLKTLRIYMDTEELAKLNDFEQITVLGKLTNIYGGTPELKDAFIIDNYVSYKQYNDEELKDKIDNFGGDGGDGNIAWNEGSYPFFIDNMLNFKKIDSQIFYSEVTGEWIGKYYVDGDKSTYSITFTSENTANVKKNDSKISEWNYSFNGENLKFPTTNSNSYEVRKVSDSLYVLYNDYKPRWIIYKN
jgi:hypothetical protein